MSGESEGGEGNRRQGENISRASAPWSRGGFVVDLVGGEGESVMVDGVTFFFFFFLFVGML